MKRIALLILALALLGCAQQDLAEGPRTQLVTEDYLRRQLDIKTAHLWGQVVAELLTGNLATDDFGEHLAGTPAAPRVTGVWADTDWPDNRRVYVEFEITGQPYAHNWYRLAIDFKGPDYNTSGGSVTQGECRQRPGAGVATTGEFTTIENRLDTPIEHQISKTVTETTASSISLTESLELSSGVTVEAGTDVAKVSATFESKFGISKTQTEDHSIETSVTVSDTAEVEPDQTAAFVYTTDDVAQDCVVHINATGDWHAAVIRFSFVGDHDKHLPFSDYSNYRDADLATALCWTATRSGSPRPTTWCASRSATRWAVSSPPRSRSARRRTARSSGCRTRTRGTSPSTARGTSSRRRTRATRPST